jgi:hypothetical protein
MFVEGLDVHSVDVLRRTAEEFQRLHWLRVAFNAVGSAPRSQASSRTTAARSWRERDEQTSCCATITHRRVRAYAAGLSSNSILQACEQK